nr:MAG TPA: hypothetical protein [Caudoviricetes sp.]
MVKFTYRISVDLMDIIQINLIQKHYNKLSLI